MMDNEFNRGSIEGPFIGFDLEPNGGAAQALVECRAIHKYTFGGAACDRVTSGQKACDWR
jgi:hypothetical protein